VAGSERDAGAGDRYGAVLSLLVVSFMLSALLPDRWARILPLLLYVAALALAFRGTPALRSGWRLRLLALLAGSAVAVVVAGVVGSRLLSGVIALWLAVILVLTIVAMVRRILAHRVVTLQTIFGALSAYLLIGFLYAALFSAVRHFQRAPLFAGGQPEDSSTVQYFSFITMTTLGYGDFTPAGEPARTLAVLDALTGQIFLVTLIARLVSLFGQARNSRE
jgi:Ion channel